MIPVLVSLFLLITATFVGCRDKQKTEFIYNDVLMILDTVTSRNETFIRRIDHVIIKNETSKIDDLKRKIDSFALSFGDSLNRVHVYHNN